MQYVKMLRRMRLRIVPAIFIMLGLCLVAGLALGQVIDPDHKFAWSENAGWQNWHSPPHGQATVYASHLEGYIWGENIGWIRLGTHTGGGSHTYTNDSNTTYGVNRTGNQLSGFAWSENVGWINFGSSDHHDGVQIDPATGDFSGYAWGENIGWVRLAGTAGDSTAYKVKAMPPGTYSLSVTSGTGGGAYAEGHIVSIAANPPEEANQIFDQWTGSTTHVANVNNPNTTVIMPAHNITVEATYIPQDETKRTLTVIGGSGSDDYKEGTIVNIAADPQEDKVFNKWTGTGEAHVANVNIPNTTVIMPGSDVSVTASFKNKPTQNFNLTVTSGTGSGSYPAGRVVRVTANAPADGKIFDIWTGQTDRLTDVNSQDTTITMPDANVAITATYRDKPDTDFTLTVTNGTGDGSYKAGTVQAISAINPEANQMFDKWAGQTSRVANPNLPVTSVTMPASNVTVTATLTARPNKKFKLERRIYKEDQAQQAATMDFDTLLSVSSLQAAEQSEPGEWHTISAPNQTGYSFFSWEGQTHNVKDVSSQITEIYMPASDVVLVAVYTQNAPGPGPGPGPGPTPPPPPPAIWDTEIGLVNPGEAGATGVLRGFDGDGTQVWSRSVALRGHGRLELNLRTVAGSLASRIKTARLDITGGEIVGYQKFYQAMTYRAGIEALPRANEHGLFVPHIASNEDWWTGIGLHNTTAEPKSLLYQFDTADQRQVDITAGGHRAFTVASMFDNVKQPQVGSARVMGGEGNVGLVLFGNEQQLGGVSLSDALATELVFSHVAHNQQWWTGIVVYNPGQETADITLEYRDAQGNLLESGSAQIEPGRRHVGTPESLGFPVGVEWFAVQSSQPVTGFVLFGTTNSQQLGGYSVVDLAATSGIFPKLEQDGWTGIALVNASGEAAEVLLEARNNQGTLIAGNTVALGPGRKLVGMAETLFPGQNINQATYIRYTSSQPLTAFQLNGSTDQTLLDGLPALGATHVGTATLYFPHIAVE